MKHKREIAALVLFIIVGFIATYMNLVVNGDALRFILEKTKLFQKVIFLFRNYIMPAAAYVFIIAGIIKKNGDKCLIIGFSINVLCYLLYTIGAITVINVVAVEESNLTVFVAIFIAEVLSVLMVIGKSKMKTVFWIPGTLMIVSDIIYISNYNKIIGVNIVKYLIRGFETCSSLRETIVYLIEIAGIFLLRIISGIAMILLFSVITKIKTKPEE